MAVQFILGRSGTGKTRLCHNQIIENLAGECSAGPLILLVPEQATYQAERAILSDGRIRGYSRLNVLSFQRLAFRLGGRFACGKQISRTGQQMVVNLILRKYASGLKVFQGRSAQAGLSQKLTNLIIELGQYNHDPADLEQFIENLKKQNSSSNTVRKFEDVLVIYKHYLEFLHRKEFLNPDYQLTQALEKIASADFIKGAKIWVDGFSDFTSQELAVLAELLRHTSDAAITMCLDPDAAEADFFDDQFTMQTSIFQPTAATYRKLRDEIVKGLKLKQCPPIMLKDAHRFKDSPAIGHIQASIFNDKAGKIDSGGAVRIVAASDKRSEIEFAAEQIIELVRRKNYRYRDIAVIISGLEEYRHFVQAVFDDYRIPFFIDRVVPINQHRLIEFLYSAVNLGTRGYNSRDVLGLLKTGLVDIDGDDIDVLENYCAAFNIDQQDWESKAQWQYQDRNSGLDLKKINRIRSDVLNIIDGLRKKLTGAQLSTAKFLNAIAEFINTNKISAKLTEDNDPLNCYLLKQLYELTEQMAHIYGDEVFASVEIAEIFLGGLSQLNFAQIPPSLDQVLVGSIERSRHPELKAAFLVGASQKQFPVPISSQSIFNEADRMLAEENEFSLSGTLRQQLLARQYLGYIAFTRPSQRLYVSWPCVDEKGSPVQGSHFLMYLKSLFSDNLQSRFGSLNTIERIYNHNHLADWLCLNAGADSQDASIGKAVLKNIRQHNGLGDICEFTDYALGYDNSARLESDFVNEYFGQSFKSSVSRLETFASCPFRYYARYILKLQPKQLSQIKPKDLGEFYHNIIDDVSKSLKKNNLNFKTASMEQLNEILDASIKICIEKDEYIKSYIAHSTHNAFVIDSAKELLGQFIAAIVKQSKVSVFELFSSETGFGFDDVKKDFTIKLDNGNDLVLRGKIDRLDIAKVDGRQLGLIIDYKLSGKSVSWDKIYHGLDIQLPVYLLAGRFDGRFTPAGAFFMPIRVNTFSKPGENAYKLKGIFNGDYAELIDKETGSSFSPYYNFCITKNEGAFGRYSYSSTLYEKDFENLLGFVEGKIKSIAGDIVSGRVDVRPYSLREKSPCNYCDYKSLCRFDWLVNRYNMFEPMDKSQMLERIQQ